MVEQRESETDLVSRAQQALSQCSWTVGECAALWTKRYARGRTDGDFGAQIGLTSDQVYQRRRVWEAFSDVRERYEHLKWSHFYAALSWDDAAECLQWANDMQATIAEMKAWRRAQRGEDLQEPAADEQPPFDPLVEFMSAEPALVRAPGTDGGDPRAARERGADEGDRERAVTATAVAREAGEEYAPFGKDARGPAPAEGRAGSSAPSAEQIFKRLTAALEKCDQALTPAILESFSELPIQVQQRFRKAVDSLASKTAGLH
ncbi:MAG: hypothetical protein KF774_20990 [Planctomyces sp.]|nr:hypothetical protein [Planctomyces sp.]